MQKGFPNSSTAAVASQSSGTTATTYTVQRPGAVLGQRGGPAGGAPHQLIIYTRNDQQPFSQGQAPGTYTIIQTQTPGEPPRTVYQPRSMVNAGRQESQRQYVQSASNGPTTSTGGSSSQPQMGSAQPPVLHIQVLPHPSAPTGTQQQLVDKSLPTTHGHPPAHSQIIGAHLQHGGQPSEPGVAADRRAGSSSGIAVHHQSQQRPVARPKVQRPLPAQQTQLGKQDDFDDLSMHPNHLPMPDSFNCILDQLHSSGESPKAFYRKLKKQFKYLVYENECYQEELRNSQRHLLKLSRDKNFLLDRLAIYETVEDPSDEDSDADSDATVDDRPKAKKKKVQQPRKRTTTGTKKNAAKESAKTEEENSQASSTVQTSNPPVGTAIAEVVTSTTSTETTET